MKWIAILISLIFIALAGVHTFVDKITIDSIGIILIVLGALPWMFPFLKSLELPGGVKIELKDVKQATDKINEEIQVNVHETTQKKSEYSYLSFVANHDPNLVLVAVRIEIEKTLREVYGETDRPIPLSRMVRELTQEKGLSPNIAEGLMELIKIGNKAAHGVDVTDGAAEWVIDVAPKLLSQLKSGIVGTSTGA